MNADENFKDWLAANYGKTGLSWSELELVRDAWDAALLAAGRACLRPLEEVKLPPKEAAEIHAANCQMHSWRTAA